MFNYANDQLSQSLEHSLTLGMKFLVLLRMSGISNYNRKLPVLRIFYTNFYDNPINHVMPLKYTSDLNDLLFYLTQKSS